MRERNAQPHDLVFPNGNGKPDGHFLRKLKAIAKKAGVEGAELHRFRKTYADTLHEEGVSVNTIRIRLGHESLDVTLAYLKGKDAESEEAQEHANSSSLALYAWEQSEEDHCGRFLTSTRSPVAVLKAAGFRAARHLGVAAMIYKMTSQEQFLRFLIINGMVRPLPEAERGNWSALVQHWGLAPQFLPLKNKVRRKDRKPEADPNNGFVRMDVKSLPSAHTTDYSHLKKNECDGKAASHPLPVLLNLSFEDEDQRNCGRNHPQSGVHRCSNTERSGSAPALLEKLDVEAEWRGHKYTRDIDSADYPMEPPEPIANSVGELHRAQQQSARAGDSMRQQPPLEGFIVLPYRILRVH
jgi:Phage integrase family